MGKLGTPPLRADVVITSLSREHAANMYRWMCDPEVRCNLGLRREPSLAESLRWVHNAQEDASICAFAIMHAGLHVGNVILDRIDKYLSSARLSVYIGEAQARGAGIGSTAIRLCLERGFEQMGLHKVWLTAHCRNFAAINTYSRLGFVLEGVLRDEFLLGDERLNVFYMGILRQDFHKLAFAGAPGPVP